MEKRPLRLASYNIRKCIGWDRRRDPHRIVDVINELGADVVLLQEADRRLGRRPAALPHELIERETDLEAVEIDRAGVSLGHHGNAILVRKGLPVGNVQKVDLPGTEPRGAVAADVGGRMRVASAHLGLLRPDRRRQLAALADAFGRDLPLAILGDFNEWSRRKGLEAFDGTFEVEVPGRSFPAIRPIAALDRAALVPDLHLHDSGVWSDGEARIASDHLPIWVEVS